VVLIPGGDRRHKGMVRADGDLNQKMRFGHASKPNRTNGKQKVSNPAAKPVKPSQNRKGKYED
jgi:hypothetical protein